MVTAWSLANRRNENGAQPVVTDNDHSCHGLCCAHSAPAAVMSDKAFGKKMKKRALAISAIIATILTGALHGAGQFGYVYFGFFGAIGAVFKELIRFTGWPALSIFVPLLAVLLILVYLAIIFTTISTLILGVFKKEDTIRKFRIEVIGCFILGVVMITGLILARLFPGDQIPPLAFPLSYFIYPTIILIISVLLQNEKTPNQALQTTTMAVTDAAAQPPRQP
jgi:NAD/NADP transhydrogenase beta subunit